ncbi:PiggyBac transposable element-derived protein 4-like [Elysia marginata]|uniref:PiggyBac transposable element-derived protein 4-like n=1 Tax=Elysia marginata TaxID=1093978 RepID=A0AAV4J5I4_9GAST|nr:PiggyBac transposable element-derived protein 4-like [Elysia marginata]
MEAGNSDTELDYESDVDISPDMALDLHEDDDQAGNNADPPAEANDPPAEANDPPAQGGAAAAAAAVPGDGDWRPEGSDIVMRHFEEQPGPRHNLGPQACPLDFFFLMFPLALIEILVAETNRYADQCIATTPNSSWYATDVAEMPAFLAIQIIFGIKQQPRLWMYWSEYKRFYDSWVAGLMTINRFKNLSRYFHCRDTSRTPGRESPNYDPLFKVRNVVDAVQETFKNCFQVNRDLSVDECMVGFKGRLSFKQYMPAKPTKWGIKVWTTCDARLGYCLGFDIYTGKASRKDPCRPLGYEVVNSLCSSHYHKGHHVYIDRFFNSVKIADHLQKNDTYVCGTIMSNRKGLPQGVKRKLRTRGDLVQLQKGNLIATAYHDKRTVHLLSSNQVMGTTEEEGKPRVLLDYNRYMGCVDKFDQQLSFYPVGRPGKKWWRYIVWHLINASIYNAYVIWTLSPPQF